VDRLPGRGDEESHPIDSRIRVSTNHLSRHPPKRDVRSDSAGVTGKNLTAGHVNLREGRLSPAAGRRGLFWPKRLPLADLFRQFTLLALVRRKFPATPKLVEPAIHKSGSSRFFFWLVAITVTHIRIAPLFGLKISLRTPPLSKQLRPLHCTRLRRLNWHGDKISVFRARIFRRSDQVFARLRGTAATRGWASSHFTSALVAALTCSRVLVRDCFVFTMVHSVTNHLPPSVSSGTPVPGPTRHLVLPGGCGVDHQLGRSLWNLIRIARGLSRCHPCSGHSSLRGKFFAPGTGLATSVAPHSWHRVVGVCFERSFPTITSDPYLPL